MKCSTDSVLLQPTNQARPFLQICCLNIEHMGIMYAVGRYEGELDAAFLGERSQQFKISVPAFHTGVIDLLRLLQLRVQIRRVDIAGKVG